MADKDELEDKVTAYEALFAEAFDEMEAKGYFTGMKAKIKAERKAKSSVKTATADNVKVRHDYGPPCKEPRQKILASSSGSVVTDKTPIAASKK